jgi:hypothetical protein
MSFAFFFPAQGSHRGERRRRLERTREIAVIAIDDPVSGTAKLETCRSLV